MKTLTKIFLPLLALTLFQFKAENKSNFIYFGDPVPGVDVSLEQIPGGANCKHNN